MKKVVIVLFLILICGILIKTYTSYHQKQVFIETCTTRQTDTNRFLAALRSNDAGSCATLGTPLHERCLAFITGDPSQCHSNDLDCIAISSHNASQCAEPVCAAMANRNETLCDQLPDSAEWCKHMVRLDQLTVDTAGCETLSSKLN